MVTWYAVTGGSIRTVEVIKENEKTLVIKGKCGMLGTYRVKKESFETKYVKSFEEAVEILKESLNRRVADLEQRLEKAKELRKKVFAQYNIS